MSHKADENETKYAKTFGQKYDYDFPQHKSTCYYVLIYFILKGVMILLKYLDQIANRGYSEIISVFLGILVSFLNISYIKADSQHHQRSLLSANIVLCIVHGVCIFEAYNTISYDFCHDVSPWLKRNCRSHVSMLYVIFFFEIIGIFFCGMLISNTRKLLNMHGHSDKTSASKELRKIPSSDDDEKSGIVI